MDSEVKSPNSAFNSLQQKGTGGRDSKSLKNGKKHREKDSKQDHQHQPASYNTTKINHLNEFFNDLGGATTRVENRLRKLEQDPTGAASENNTVASIDKKYEDDQAQRSDTLVSIS